MSRLTEQEPMMRNAEVVIDGDVFRIKLDERDVERLRAAWERREKKLFGESRINGFDVVLVVLAAIACAHIGFVIALLLAEFGWLS